MKAPVLNITQTNEFGKDTFKFTARGTEYTMIDDSELYGEGFFAVWTSRISCNGLTVKVLSIAEMRAGKNKTLQAFASVVAA